MRTFSGYEAIEIAEQHNLLLYDVSYKSEVTVEEANQFIESQRNPKSFVLRNWPETEEEAEQVVLQAFNRILKEKRWSEARISDIAAGTDQDMPIHPKAAELAADSLVEMHKLEIVERGKDGNVYRIPRTFYLKDDFLDSLSGTVCDECAKLDFEAGFHEPCLRALLGFLSQGPFNLKDITEVRDSKGQNGLLAKMNLPAIDIPWLTKTASATKSRWMSVIRPKFVKEYTDADMTIHAPKSNVTHEMANQEIVNRPEPTQQENESHRVAKEMAAASAIGAENVKTRTKVPKETLISDLVSYLRSVEILDENGELNRLQMERAQLTDELARRQQDVESVERERAFLEKQCQEMQNDLDTLLQAMQIAKRRSVQIPHVIEAITTGDSKDDF